MIIIFSLEGISRIALNENSCEANFLKSNSNPELDVSEIQQICIDYQTIVANRHSPNSHLEPNFDSKTIHTNEFGFRGTGLNLDKEQDIFRVFVVGGSTVYGANASNDEKTIPGYLQKLLNEPLDKKKFEVINAGVPGDWSFQESYKIENELIKFNPDLIIIYDGWNELNFNNIEFGEDYFGYLMSYLPQKFQYFYHTPEFITKVFHFLGKERYDDLGKASEEKVSRWYDRHSKICKLGKEENFQVMIIFQPLLNLGNKPVTDFEKNILENHPQPMAKIAHPIFQDKMSKLNEKCHNTLDFTNIFDETEKQVFFDNGHINDLGNEIVGNEIANIVLNKIKND